MTIGSGLSAVSSTVNGLVQLLPFLLRRSGIRHNVLENLELLKMPRAEADFGDGSLAVQALVKSIEFDVCLMSGVDLRQFRRQVSWGAVVLAAILCGGASYLSDFFGQWVDWWYAAIPGVFALLMFVTLLGLLNNRVENPPPGVTTPKPAGMIDNH